MNRNIRLFIAYRVISRLYFHLPVLFLLFWSVQITYGTATLLLATYSAASTLAADIMPRLASWLSASRLVQLGEGMKACGLTLLVLATFPGNVCLSLLILGQCIGGIGFAMALAADGGMLRSVAVNVAPKALGAIQAKTQSLMFMATLVAGFIGGVLFDHEAHWPFYAGIAASLASIFAVMMISEPSAPPAPSSAPTAVKLELNREQTTWVGFYALTRAFALTPFIGLLPLHFALQQVDPYLFGLVLGLFTLSGFAVALWGAPLLEKLGPEGGVWLTCGGLAGSLGLFAASDWLEHCGISYFASALLGIALLGFAAGVIRPVVMTRLDLSNLNPAQRMAVFASMERACGYLSACLLLLFGVFVENASLTVAFSFALCGLLFSLVAGICWRHLTPVAC